MSETMVYFYTAIALVLVPLVAGLVRAETGGYRVQVYLFKPASIILVIGAALLPRFLGHPVDPVYANAILAALVVSLFGDIALMFPSRRAFMAGLVFFLTAHVIYTWIFARYSAVAPVDGISAGALLAAGIFLYRYLSPGLDTYRVPVIIYMIIISVMVNRAVAFAGDPLGGGAGALAAVGALLFFISDVMLAIAQFRNPFPYNRTSLFFYFSGQFLLALSVGVKP